MVTSRLCPLNKKYNRFEANKLAVKRRAMAGAAMRRAHATAAADASPENGVTTGAATEVCLRYFASTCMGYTHIYIHIRVCTCILTHAHTHTENPSNDEARDEGAPKP